MDVSDGIHERSFEPLSEPVNIHSSATLKQMDLEWNPTTAVTFGVFPVGQDRISRKFKFDASPIPYIHIWILGHLLRVQELSTDIFFKCIYKRIVKSENTDPHVNIVSVGVECWTLRWQDPPRLLPSPLLPYFPKGASHLPLTTILVLLLSLRLS